MSTFKTLFGLCLYALVGFLMILGIEQVLLVLGITGTLTDWLPFGLTLLLVFALAWTQTSNEVVIPYHTHEEGD